MCTFACMSLLVFVTPANAAMQVLQRPDPLAQTTAMELWFRAPSAGDGGQYPGIARLALTALAASSAPHGTSLAELVNRFGGTLSLNVYPDIAMIGVSVPSAQAPQVLHALTSAYFAPSISSDGYKAALRDCAVAAAQTRFDAERILQDALFANLFSAGPARVAPTPGTAADFTKIPQDAAQAFARHAFRADNSVLSVAGAVDAQLLAGVQSGASGSMDAPYDSTLAAQAASSTKSAYVSGIGFAWAGPPISDAKAATAMDFIADYLFDPDRGTLAQAVQKTDANAYVSGQFITLHNPGVLLLTISGAASPQIRSQINDAVAAMQQPMDAKAFAAARAAFEYHIFSQTQTPMSLADNFGWYAAEGDATYAPGSASGEYLKAAQALDPSYIAQVARTYLKQPAAVQLIAAPQKGSST
jgi:predicted Zn-dependent peptidase